MPPRIRGSRQHRQAVLAQQFDLGALHRIAGGDGMHEDVVAPVGIGLHQHPEIRHQGHATVMGTDDPFPLRVPPLDLDEEQASRCQERGEIKGREYPFPGMTWIQVDDLRGQLRKVVGVEPVAEPRVADVAPRLARQVVERTREKLLDLHLEGIDTPRRKGKHAVPGQRQQRPVLGNGRFLRIVRRPDDLVVGRRQRKVPLRGQSPTDAEIDVASGGHIEGDAVQRGGVALRRVDTQFQQSGPRQHARRDLPGRAPSVLTPRHVVDRVIFGQQPAANAARETVAVDLVGEGHHGGLHRGVVGSRNDGGTDAFDAEVGLPVRHPHLDGNRLVDPAIAIRRREIRRHGHRDEVLALGNGENLRVDVGRAVERSVLDPGLEGTQGTAVDGAVTHRQAQALLEIGPGHGVREIETGHHPAIGHDFGMLVERGVGHRGCEGRRLELHLPGGEQDSGREELR